MRLSERILKGILLLVADLICLKIVRLTSGMEPVWVREGIRIVCLVMVLYLAYLYVRALFQGVWTEWKDIRRCIKTYGIVDALFRARTDKEKEYEIDADNEDEDEGG